MFTVMARLRKLIDMALQLSQQPSLNQSLDIVVKEACGCLFSDRASVFVFDSEKEQLWTRAQKGQNVIRIPYTKGIAGHVFTSGQLVNIMNAYSDTRFD
jgi:signal transduction protein with GAF and PtsI domain